MCTTPPPPPKYALVLEFPAQFVLAATAYALRHAACMERECVYVVCSSVKAMQHTVGPLHAVPLCCLVPSLLVSLSRLASNPCSGLFTPKPATLLRLVWGYGALLSTNRRHNPVIGGFPFLLLRSDCGSQHGTWRVGKASILYCIRVLFYSGPDTNTPFLTFAPRNGLTRPTLAYT